MDKASYINLFQKLEFNSIEARKTLKHPNMPISVYFNSSRSPDRVYFTVYARDAGYFNEEVWDHLPPQQKKDEQSKLRTVVPKSGMEERAFYKLISGDSTGKNC